MLDSRVKVRPMPQASVREKKPIPLYTRQVLEDTLHDILAQILKQTGATNVKEIAATVPVLSFIAETLIRVHSLRLI